MAESATANSMARVEALQNAAFDRIEEEILNSPISAPIPMKKAPGKGKKIKKEAKNGVPGEPTYDVPDWCFESIPCGDIRLLDTKEKADVEAQMLYDYTIKCHEGNIAKDENIPKEFKPRCAELIKALCFRVINCLRVNAPRCGITSMPQALALYREADITSWNVKNAIRQACECAVVYALGRYFPHDKAVHSYADLMEKCDYFRVSRSHHWRGKGSSESDSTKEQRWKDVLDDLPGLLEFHNAMLWAKMLWDRVTVQHTCDTVSLGVEGKKYANGSGRSVKADCRLEMIRSTYNKPIRARQKKLEEGDKNAIRAAVHGVGTFHGHSDMINSVLRIATTSSTMSNHSMGGNVDYYRKEERAPKEKKKMNRKEKQAQSDLMQIWNSPHETQKKLLAIPSFSTTYIPSSASDTGQYQQHHYTGKKRGRKKKGENDLPKKRGRPKSYRPKMAFDPSIWLVDADNIHGSGSKSPGRGNSLSPRSSLSLQNPTDDGGPGGLYPTESIGLINFGDQPNSGPGSRLARQQSASGTYAKPYRSYSTRHDEDGDAPPSTGALGPPVNTGDRYIGMGQPLMSRTRSGGGSTRSLSGTEHEMLLLLRQDSNGNMPRSNSPRSSPRETGSGNGTLPAPPAARSSIGPSALDLFTQAIESNESGNTGNGSSSGVAKMHSLDMAITQQHDDPSTTDPTSRPGSKGRGSRSGDDMEFLMTARRS